MHGVSQTPEHLVHILTSQNGCLENRCVYHNFTRNHFECFFSSCVYTDRVAGETMPEDPGLRLTTRIQVESQVMPVKITTVRGRVGGHAEIERTRIIKSVGLCKQAEVS